MGVLDCEWASSCFRCRYNWCRKYCSGPNNNLHLGDADMIIATFPDRDYGYYKEDELSDLAKKVDATEAEVLKAANTDGWLNGTVLIWVKDKPDLITKVKAFWPDGSSKFFENATRAAKYFDASLQTISVRARGRRIFNDVLLLKDDSDPTEDELVILRRKVPTEGDIPVPTAQEQEAIARLNVAREELQGKHGNFAGVLCTWKTGEQIMFDTVGLMLDVLRISSYTFDKHAISGEPYRGITFKKIVAGKEEQEQEQEHEAEETGAELAE